LRADTLPFPIALWYEPESFAVLDHTTQHLWLAASSPQGLDQLEDTLEIAPRDDSTEIPRYLPQPASLHLDLSAGACQAAVRQAQAHIRAGDVFQVNLSLRFSSQTSHPSWYLYRQLQTINPSPFACYWRTPWEILISCSPERLVRLQEGQAETRPIAGTRPRAKRRPRTSTIAKVCSITPRSRAEHIMLVDLERNDLGRVCRWGSVEVTELLTVEYYSHVMHLVQ
jgi:para-aminobenzoate synthetase component 1